jgi:hypothetical protein
LLAICTTSTSAERGCHHTSSSSSFRERVRDEEQFFYKFFSQKKMLAKLSGEEETTDKKKKSKDDLEFAGETDKETGKTGLSLSLSFGGWLGGSSPAACSGRARRHNRTNITWQASTTTTTWS